MPPLRVTALMDTAIVSGPGRQLVAVARALRAFDVETQLITFHRHGRPSSALPAFARAADVQCEVVEERRRLDPRILSRVSALVRASGAHIIQSHSYKPAAVAALLRRPLGVPWIGIFHGTTMEDRRVRLYNLIDRQLLRRADRVVVVAAEQRALFPACGDRLSVIPNAVLPRDSGLSKQGDATVELLARPRIAVIGRLSHEKGVDVLLHAIAILRDRGFTGHALVIGDGPDRAALEALVASLSLTGVVSFLGHRVDAQALYRQLDMIVIPSRSEGMPNVLLEAVRDDVPVVATAVGAIPEVVGTSPGVLLVPSGQPDILADAIDRGLRELQSAFASAGRAAMAHAFSLDHRAQTFRDLYDAVLTAPANRHTTPKVARADA